MCILCTCICVPMCSNVFQYVPMCSNVFQCVPMCSNVHVHMCVRMCACTRAHGSPLQSPMYVIICYNVHMCTCICSGKRPRFRESGPGSGKRPRFREKVCRTCFAACISEFRMCVNGFRIGFTACISEFRMRVNWFRTCFAVTYVCYNDL